MIVQNDIQGYEDLQGKTLIVDAPDTAFALLLFKMLEIKGLKRGDYTIKPVGGSLQRYEAMLKDKSNAGTMLGLPSSVRSLKNGLKSLGASADVTGPYLAAGVFTRGDWGKANSEKLTQYIAANIEGIRWAMLPDNKKDVLSIISEQLKLPEDVEMLQSRGTDPDNPTGISTCPTIIARSRRCESRFGLATRIMASATSMRASSSRGARSRWPPRRRPQSSRQQAG